MRKLTLGNGNAIWCMMEPYCTNRAKINKSCFCLKITGPYPKNLHTQSCKLDRFLLVKFSPPDTKMVKL